MFKFFFKTLLMFKIRMYLHVDLSQLCPNFSQYDNSNTFLTCWGQSYKQCVITTSLLGLRLCTTFNKSRIPIVTKSLKSKRPEVFNMVLVLMWYQIKCSDNQSWQDGTARGCQFWSMKRAGSFCVWILMAPYILSSTKKIKK